jgi:hypothetical protein
VWAVVLIVGGAAVPIDPGGLQAFFVLRLFTVAVGVVVGTAHLVRFGVNVPGSRVVIGGAALLLGALGVSGAVGGEPAVAWLGASARQMGVITWLVFAVAGIVGLSLLDEDDRRLDRVLHIVAAASILWLAFVALLETSGSPIVEPSQAFGDRVQSTFGNPAVLGAFLCLALPLAAVGITRRRDRLLSAAAVAAGAWLLVSSGTRGAWMGIAVAVVSAAVVVLRSRRFGRVGLAGAIAALVVVVALGAAGGRWSSALGSAEGRLGTWQVAGDVIADSPVLGVGPEGFATAFAEHVDDDFVIRYSRDNITDRAHNGLIDLTVTSGALGLAGYLVVCGGVAVVVARALRRRDPPDWMGVAMAGAVAAYLVQQQAFFQLAAVDAAFWLVAGMLAARLGASRAVEKPGRAIAVAAAAVATLFALYAALGVVADHYDRAALRADGFDDQLTRFETAAALRPVDAIHATMAVERLRGVTDRDAIDRQLDLLDRAARWAPDDGTLVLARSEVLVAAHEAYGDAASLAEAGALLTGLVARDTTNGQALLRLGQIA